MLPQFVLVEDLELIGRRPLSPWFPRRCRLLLSWFRFDGPFLAFSFDGGFTFQIVHASVARSCRGHVLFIIFILVVITSI
jgi:hypothetical protein